MGILWNQECIYVEIIRNLFGFRRFLLQYIILLGIPLIMDGNISWISKKIVASSDTQVN
jgi:hypothetical protein